MFGHLLVHKDEDIKRRKFQSYAPKVEQNWINVDYRFAQKKVEHNHSHFEILEHELDIETFLHKTEK